MIANDQSEFSLRSIQINSFHNEINNHGKRLLEMAELMVTHKEDPRSMKGMEKVSSTTQYVTKIDLHMSQTLL